MAADSSPSKGAASAKDKRRREAKEKSRIAANKFEETKKENDALKHKLEQLAKSHKDGKASENTEEYDQLKTKADSLVQTLRQVEEEAQLAKKAEDQEMKDADSNEEELFVDPGNPITDISLKSESSFDGVNIESIPAAPQTGSGLPAHSFGEPPVVDLTDTSGNPQPLAIDEDPEDAGLFTPANAREATGRTDDGDIVAWTERGYSTPVIISFGPPNARKYERSTAYRSGIPFDKGKTDQFGPDHRHGDEKQGRKFVRRWDDFKGIQGEAYNCKLAELKPKEKGEKRAYPLTELLVKWEIDGKVKRTWETRSSIKHLWPNPTLCDEYIYVSAEHHHKQHQDWLNGERKATSKSPSPGPDMQRLRPHGTPPPEPEIKNEHENANGGSPPKGNKSPMAAMREYREEWCALEDIDPTEMSPEDKANFLLTWNMMKVRL